MSVERVEKHLLSVWQRAHPAVPQELVISELRFPGVKAVEDHILKLKKYPLIAL